jgi:hypothetical protein
MRLRSVFLPALLLALSALVAPALAQAQDHSVFLVWVPPVVLPTVPPSTPTSYQVWRGTTAGGETFLANAGQTNGLANTTYTDTTVIDGTTYFYVAYSLNASGPSATPSNEVSAVIPPATVVTPPPPPQTAPPPPVLQPPTVQANPTTGTAATAPPSNVKAKAK